MTEPPPRHFAGSQPAPTWSDRFRGAMLGGAVGDALGAGVRTQATPDLLSWFGPGGVTDYLPVFGRRGSVTELTQLTVFTVEALLQAKAIRTDPGPPWLHADLIRANHLRWLYTQGVPWEYAMWTQLQEHPRPHGWLLERPELYTTRNPAGAALRGMGRMALPTVYGPPLGHEEVPECAVWAAPAMVWGEPGGVAFQAGGAVSLQMTSAHDTHAASAFQTDVLAQLIRGVGLWDAVGTSEGYLAASAVPSVAVPRAVHTSRLATQHGRRPSPESLDIEFDTRGRLGELGIALASVAATDNFVDAIVMAVNQSADSCVTGALAGQLAGAVFGPSAIPPRWLDELELRDVIETLCADAAEAFAPPPPLPKWAQRYVTDTRSTMSGPLQLERSDNEETAIVDVKSFGLGGAPEGTEPWSVGGDQDPAPPTQVLPVIDAVGEEAPTPVRPAEPERVEEPVFPGETTTGPDVGDPLWTEPEPGESTSPDPAPGASVSWQDGPTQDAPTQDAPTQDAPTQDAPTWEGPTRDVRPDVPSVRGGQDHAVDLGHPPEPVEETPDPFESGARDEPARPRIDLTVPDPEPEPEPDPTQQPTPTRRGPARLWPDDEEDVEAHGEHPPPADHDAPGRGASGVEDNHVEGDRAAATAWPEPEVWPEAPPHTGFPVEADRSGSHDVAGRESPVDDTAEEPSRPAVPEAAETGRAAAVGTAGPDADPEASGSDQRARDDARPDSAGKSGTSGTLPTGPPQREGGGHAVPEDVDAVAPSLTERVLGSFLGGALGDALGSDLEALTAEQITERFGPDGPSGLREAYGVHGAVTDDTQMTLFTAEGLIRAGIARRTLGREDPVPEVQLAYQRWLHTQGVEWDAAAGPLLDDYPQPDGWLICVPGLFSTRAPGNTVFRSLDRFGRGIQPGSPSEPVNDSKGCGGVMRAAPAALWSSDPAEVFELAAHTAALTHGHPSGYLSAGAFAVIVQQAVLGRGLDDGVWLALQVLETWEGHEETSNALAMAVDVAASGVPGPDRIAEMLGGGWVGEQALAIAVCATLAAGDDVELALRTAVHHAGASDSTGAICGNIIGALAGIAGLPVGWLADLELRDVVEQVALDCVVEFDRGTQPATTAPTAPAPGGTPVDDDWHERYPVGAVTARREPAVMQDTPTRFLPAVSPWGRVGSSVEPEQASEPASTATGGADGRNEAGGTGGGVDPGAEPHDDGSDSGRQQAGGAAGTLDEGGASETLPPETFAPESRQPKPAPRRINPGRPWPSEPVTSDAVHQPGTTGQPGPTRQEEEQGSPGADAVDSEHERVVLDSYRDL